MTGQVDVGFGAAPFGLDLVEGGKTRIIATGNDVTALRSRAVRVNLTGAQTLATRHAQRDRAYRTGLPEKPSTGCDASHRARLQDLLANIPGCRIASCSAS